MTILNWRKVPTVSTRFNIRYLAVIHLKPTPLHQCEKLSDRHKPANPDERFQWDEYKIRCRNWCRDNLDGPFEVSMFEPMSSLKLQVCFRYGADADRFVGAWVTARKAPEVQLRRPVAQLDWFKAIATSVNK